MAGVKINTRGIVAYANSLPDPVKQGELRKGGDGISMKQRYFVLRGNLLFYFKTQSEYQNRKDPTGLICLEDYSIERTECPQGASGQVFRLTSLHGNPASKSQKDFILEAANEAEAASWIKALQCANCGYMQYQIRKLKMALREQLVKNGSKETSVDTLCSFQDYEIMRHEALNGQKKLLETAAITIKTLSGVTTKVEVHSFDTTTIGTIMGCIAEKLNIPSDEQSLSFNGERLSDHNKSLAQCSLKDGSVVNVIWDSTSAKSAEAEKVTSLVSTPVTPGGKKRISHLVDTLQQTESSSSKTTSKEIETGAAVSNIRSKFSPQDKNPDVLIKRRGSVTKAGSSQSSDVPTESTEKEKQSGAIELPATTENDQPTTSSGGFGDADDWDEEVSSNAPHGSSVATTEGSDSVVNNLETCTVVAPDAGHGANLSASNTVVPTGDARRPSLGMAELRQAKFRESALLFQSESATPASPVTPTTPGATGDALTARKSSGRFSSPAAQRCVCCNKTVYAMEKIVADGQVWNKSCFKCCTCKKVLSLGNFAALEGKLYCKPCFKKLFKLKGNYSEGFGKEQHKYCCCLHPRCVIGQHDCADATAVPSLCHMQDEMGCTSAE
eukprot:m.709389 g.709389  ORF g.709389 m.709389 type:complete len:613 (+) comp22944_c0_seq5:228-2066(+)